MPPEHTLRRHPGRGDRNKRSKTALVTELETIPGIGEKTVVDLLKHFKSAKRVSYAKIDELEEVVGKSKASKIYEHYNKE